MHNAVRLNSIVPGGNTTGGCGAWIGGSNILIDGRPRWTKLLSWRGNLDEGQSAIHCDMAAAFLMVYIVKHCVVGGMDIQDSPITIIEAFLNDQHFRGACVTCMFCFRYVVMLSFP